MQGGWGVIVSILFWQKKYAFYMLLTVLINGDYQAGSGIEVLCGGDMDILHESQHQPDAESSFDPVPAKGQSLPYVDISQKSYTVQDMVRRIFRTGEITKGYQTFFENCKDFACRLYNHFSPYEADDSKF